MVAPGLVVLLDEQHAGQLAMGACRRLEGHFIHAGDLAQVFAGKVHHLKTALCSALRLERVDCSKTGEGGNLVVDLWVVLHGTGA